MASSEIRVLLKYLSCFWRTLEIPLINCKINLTLTWSEDFISISGLTDDQVRQFAIIADTSFYVPVVTLST